ncbi:hypothetical protein DTO013E5_5870 [Penicillium roqueforti]|uniref:Genomic scaffold, ProqFM164S01 n=1 Tax=Penicillium roqueforti (strain FM164) TaxID=1365484 RepID=W6QHS9_PENRF|nr:hypothetical protein CBS147337_3051 [Penicillium roqueforti]CDM29162.1 unnamed protein product [Penicillium roqueforti FM164]KAI2678290.1 hypothetical protein LCP963914a_7721 [Penicillium roqueforti]KAI2682924.1 hypothetical protein CBS147355_2064 [Penicillium roqueforti]KAI2717350.1 hypothetical protein CBS147354_6636 [Penicillium roqueforti]
MPQRGRESSVSHKRPLVPPSTIPLASHWKQHSTQPSSGHVTLPSEEDSEGILTSDCAKVNHVFGGVKDGLSETRRGLVPEEEDSDGRQGEDIEQSPTGVMTKFYEMGGGGYRKGGAEDTGQGSKEDTILRAYYMHGFSESLGGHRRHQNPNLWNFSIRDSTLVTCSMKRTLRAFLKA